MSAFVNQGVMRSGVRVVRRSARDRAVLDPILRSIPAGRLGTADEVGGGGRVADLAGFVTGQVIHLDDGAVNGR
jgi:hypothetical protein